MQLTILSSGSGGNVLCIASGETCIYVDAGLQNGRLRERWQRFSTLHGGTPRAQARAVFLTHEHADHATGADDLAAQGLPLYATAGTAAAARLSARGRAQVREIAAGTPVVHGALRVLPVALPHDAAGPVAYVIEDGTLRLGVLTDCGAPSAEVARSFADCDALVLETNHDRRMLLCGPYSERLKRRIASGMGHLSNAQSAELLTAILSVSRIQPALVVCAHLSKTNNRPELAVSAVRSVLPDPRTRVLVAAQDDPMAPLALGPGHRPSGQQLLLGI